jgi:hypothetical protein
MNEKTSYSGSELFQEIKPRGFFAFPKDKLTFFVMRFDQLGPGIFECVVGKKGEGRFSVDRDHPCLHQS